MTRLCRMPGCTREAAASSGGTQYAYCEVCTKRLLAEAFAPAEPEWVRRMRERRGVVKDYTRG